MRERACRKVVDVMDVTKAILAHLRLWTGDVNALAWVKSFYDTEYIELQVGSCGFEMLCLGRVEMCEITGQGLLLAWHKEVAAQEALRATSLIYTLQRNRPHLLLIGRFADMQIFQMHFYGSIRQEALRVYFVQLS